MDRHRYRAHGNCGAFRWSETRLAALTLTLVGWALATAGATTAEASTQHPATAASRVFDGVTVVDVEQGKLIPDQRVVIAGNRIQAMGNVSAVPLPQGAQVVDAHGKYLMPGLWDMHSHPRRYSDFFYPLLIANGVTGIRDAGSEVPLDTLGQWKREIAAGTRVGPRMVVAGPAIDEDAACARSGGTIHTCVSDSADAHDLVDSLKAAGADFIKLYGLSPAMYFALAAEARRMKIPAGGHAEQVTAIDASDSGVSIVDHMQYKMGPRGVNALCWAGTPSASIEQCQPVAERFRRNGTWLVPTLVRYQGAGGTHAALISTHFTERAREFWAGSLLHGNWLHDSASSETSHALGSGSISDSLGAMHVMEHVGLPILAGTDAGAPFMEAMPPGFALHTELAMYVAEGLTPLNALQAATLNPAKYLHGTDSLGTIASGKLADLVLLDANPLADITNTTAIRAVVANGRYYDRAALDRLLAEIQAKAKQEPQPLGGAR